jgi:hypothetical protein
LMQGNLRGSKLVPKRTPQFKMRFMNLPNGPVSRVVMASPSRPQARAKIVRPQRGSQMVVYTQWALHSTYGKEHLFNTGRLATLSQITQ